MAAIKPEELIEEVRKYRVLYDQTEELYRNSDYKDMAWKKVAKALNVEGQEDECKKKWNGFRDSLRRARQKRKTKSGQAATSCYKYKYEDILEFLIPHIAERKGLSNVPDQEDENDVPETGNQCQQWDYTQETQQHSDSAYAEEPDETIEPLVLLTTKTPANRVSVEKKGSNADRKRKLSNTEVNTLQCASSQLMAYILAEKEAEKRAKSNSSQNSEQHPIDAFLAGIAPSLKSLDPIRLLAAKGKIFNVVQEYELQQLRSNSQHRTTTTYLYSSTSSTQTSSASPPAHIPLPEDETHADDGFPHSPNHVTPTSAASSKEDDTSPTYFQFPDDPILQAKWLEAIGQPDEKLPPRRSICSLHFSANEQMKVGGRMRLLGNPTPKLKLDDSRFESNEIAEKAIHPGLAGLPGQHSYKADLAGTAEHSVRLGAIGEQAELLGNPIPKLKLGDSMVNSDLTGGLSVAETRPIVITSGDDGDSTSEDEDNFSGSGSTTDTCIMDEGFPEDEATREVWRKSLGIGDLLITKKTKVCSLHFPEETIVTCDGKPKLMESAVPVKTIRPTKIKVPSHPFTLTCCIPDCTSNQNTPGIQWLSVPYSTVDQERDLPTELKSGNLICHKHFADCFLIKGGTYVTEASSIHEYLSKTGRAAGNASPTIFAERLDESAKTSEKPKTHTMNLEKMCRTCSVYIANEQERRSLFQCPDSLKTNRPDILEELIAFGLKIQEDDNLPQQICQLCLESFSTVIQFRDQCRRVETKFLECYKQLSDKQSTEVSEPINTNKSVDETIVIHDDIDVPAAADSSHRKDLFFGGQELPDPLDVSRAVVFEVSLPQQNNDDVDADEIATVGSEIQRLIANVKERVEKSQNDFNDIQEWEIEKRDEWSCEYFIKLDDVYMASDGEDDRTQEYKENKQQPKQQNKISNDTNTSHATYTSQLEKTYHTKIPEVVNFECNLCNRIFSSKRSLLLHQDSFHFAGPVTCGVCRTICQTMDELREHKKGCRKPAERANAKCDYCNYQFKAPALLKQHMRKHTREKPFLCDTCGASFPYKQGFEEHLKGHTDVSASNFLCDYCDKKFTTLRRWRNHRTFHITDHRHVKVICKVCDGKFPKLMAVYKHMRDEHKLNYKMHTLKLQREFLCCICSERFNDYLTVKQHVELSHAEQLLSCNKCGSVHPDRISLVKHIQLNHIDEMDVKCGICDEQFTSVNLLQEHIKKHCDDKPLGSPDIIEQLDESESDSEEKSPKD